MKLSIVTTLYNSENFIEEFCQRISDTAIKITSDFEIILVNDGCPSNSLEIAKKVADNNHRVKVVNLSRNFAHHKAIITGLIHAEGDLSFIIDCDLEERPEDLLKFFEKMKNENCDVVIGVVKERKGGIMEKYVEGYAYNIINFLCDVKIPKNTTTATLMNKNYKNSFTSHRDRALFFGGVRYLTGFKQSYLKIEKPTRPGVRNYTLRKKLSQLINAITSFSSKPLYYVFFLGCAISAISFLFGSYLLYKRIFLEQSLTGWTSLMVSIWFVGGIITICLGIIAIYLAKIFAEIKERPYTTVESIYKKE